jgi:hypothetical protein
MTPRGLSREAAADWDLLAVAPDTVDVARRSSQPEPVRRWLSHALPADGLVGTSVELRMHGQIRIGDWRPFTAVQRSSLSYGFVWAATARMLGLPIVGYDRYTRGSGELRWRLLNAIPVMSAAGADVTRSAAGRHAAELLVAAPAVALDPRVSWQPVDGNRAQAGIALDGHEQDMTVKVGSSGALQEFVMMRWGKPAGVEYGAYVFGAALTDDATFDGVTIPRQVTAGWHYGTDRWDEGAFIRWTVDDARYR